MSNRHKISWYILTFLIPWIFLIHFGMALVNINNYNSNSTGIWSSNKWNRETVDEPIKLECSIIDFNTDDNCTSICRVRNQTISENEEEVINASNPVQLERYLFEICPVIETLSMNDSNVMEIEVGVFEKANSLKHLYLARNTIEYIPNDAFKGAYLLTLLDLSDNNIKTIEIDAFKKLNKLMVLDLSRNKLIDLHPKLLQECISLTTLLLNNNQLTHLELHFTTRILQYIDVSHNHLVELIFKTPNSKKQQSANMRNYSNATLVVDSNNVINLTISPVINMFKISLARNNLTELSQLIKLRPFTAKILNLEDNHLEYLDPKHLPHSNKLEQLFLKGNRLAELDVQELKSHFANLKLITLSGNDLECKDLKKIMRHLEFRGIQVLDANTSVSAAANVNGIKCFDAKNEIYELELEYSAKLNKYILITVCTISLLAILMAFITFNSCRTIQRIRSDSLSRSFEIKMTPSENIYEEHVYNNVYNNPITPTTTL